LRFRAVAAFKDEASIALNLSLFLLFAQRRFTSIGEPAPLSKALKAGLHITQ
jgi:hypothetical protein